MILRCDNKILLSDLYLSFSLIKLPLTCANFGVTLLNNAFFVNPILPADRCNFDITFRRSFYITAIPLGKLLVRDKFAIKLFAATVLKTHFYKNNPKIVTYRNCKNFNNRLFHEELENGLIELRSSA